MKRYLDTLQQKTIKAKYYLFNFHRQFNPKQTNIQLSMLTRASSPKVTSSDKSNK